MADTQNSDLELCNSQNGTDLQQNSTENLSNEQNKNQHNLQSNVNQQNENENLEEHVDTLNMPTSEMDAELERMKLQLKQMEAATLLAQNQANAQSSESDQQADNHNDNDNNTNEKNDTDVNETLNEDDMNKSNSTIPMGQNMTPEQALADADARSIYVGNVDYKATSEELNAYFSDCGEINRITIMCNKATGQPKGFAYVEFQDHNAVQNAIILNESMFKGRQLKIGAKRTNIPGMGLRGYGRGRSRYNRGGRGHFHHGRRPRRSARGRWVPY